MRPVTPNDELEAELWEKIFKMREVQRMCTGKKLQYLFEYQITVYRMAVMAVCMDNERYILETYLGG